MNKCECIQICMTKKNIEHPEQVKKDEQNN